MGRFVGRCHDGSNIVVQTREFPTAEQAAGAMSHWLRYNCMYPHVVVDLDTEERIQERLKRYATLAPDRVPSQG